MPGKLTDGTICGTDEYPDPTTGTKCVGKSDPGFTDAEKAYNTNLAIGAATGTATGTTTGGSPYDPLAGCITKAAFDALLVKPFHVEEKDYKDDTPKDPIEKCSDCCKERTKKWNEHCSKKHKAVAKKLKEEGCPATVKTISKRHCGKKSKESKETRRRRLAKRRRK